MLAYLSSILEYSFKNHLYQSSISWWSLRLTMKQQQAQKNTHCGFSWTFSEHEALHSNKTNLDVVFQTKKRGHHRSNCQSVTWCDHKVMLRCLRLHRWMLTRLWSRFGSARLVVDFSFHLKRVTRPSVQGTAGSPGQEPQCVSKLHGSSKVTCATPGQTCGNLGGNVRVLTADPSSSNVHRWLHFVCHHTNR